MIITDEVTFNNIYTLSKDPVLQAVLAIPATSPARGQAAYNAAYAGEIVDADIAVDDVLGRHIELEKFRAEKSAASRAKNQKL